MLQNHPTATTESTTSKAIATCGWTADNFMPKPDTTVTARKFVVTHVNWDGTTLSYAGEYWNFENGLLTSVTPAQSTTIDTPVAY